MPFLSSLLSVLSAATVTATVIMNAAALSVACLMHITCFSCDMRCRGRRAILIM